MFFCLSSYADELIKNKILINGIKIYKKANCLGTGVEVEEVMELEYH